jgi:hypothetical protein
VAALVLALLSPVPALAGPPVPAAGFSAGVTPVTRVDPAAGTPSGPAWLITKNAMATGPERTALLDAMMRQIERQQAGDTIGLTTWSFHSERISTALVAAKKRGVGVRVVVDPKTWKTTAVRSLRKALGTSTTRASYIVAPYTASTHTKVGTFSRDKTVLISSANISDPRQWNHSVVLQNSDLYRQTSAWVDRLAAGTGMRYSRVATPGVVLHFYPGTVDPVLDAIRNADGRRITVQMSIWKGARGQAVADALVQAYRRGSPIAVNTGEPWSDAVRTVAAAGIDVFDTRRATGGRAKAHDKLLVVGDEVYTGSTNWGAFPRRFSEVVAHISSPSLAAQLVAYVDRTRVQAGGLPIFPAPQPQPLAVEPGAGAVTVTWSAAGPYDLRALSAFEVTLSRVTAGGGQVVSQRRTVAPAKAASGRVDPVAAHQVTFDGLAGGRQVVVAVTPLGAQGPLGPPQTARVTPYLTQAVPPLAVAAAPVRPGRASVAFTPAQVPYAPPTRSYEVAWSSDAGRTWKARTVTRPPLTLSGLPTSARTTVKVRTVPHVGTASTYSPSSSVIPTTRPAPPTAVTLRERRDTVTAVRWVPPTYTGSTSLRQWVVRYKVDDRRWKRTVVANPDARQVVVRGLPTRGTLQVRVAAVNRDERSRFTPVAMAVMRPGR